MKRLVILAAIVASVALVACGGDSNGNDSATTAAAGTNMSTVAVQDVGDAGSVLVDSSGQALYTSDQEAGGAVLCINSCESIWKPVTVNGGMPTGSVPGKLGVVKRPDGSEQATYNGAPLYSFTQDGTGEVTGDGFSDSFGGQQFTWHVVSVGSAPSQPTTTSSGSGGYGY